MTRLRTLLALLTRPMSQHRSKRTRRTQRGSASFRIARPDPPGETLIHDLPLSFDDDLPWSTFGALSAFGVVDTVGLVSAVP